ncbi:unnamed protein product [Paramecium octaurelia]|uniref:Uncharacterized protein n=1 Tax=Paramecium octaurelia TaxID=43137 RepID=A0A8S1VY84_PAROT|nr:unnamed protein product [Paramecium octaurelia]
MVNSTILSNTKQIRGFSFQLKKPKAQKSISIASQRIRRGFSFVVEQWKISKFQSQLFSQNESLIQSSISMASQDISIMNSEFSIAKKIRGFSFVRNKKQL